MPRYLPMGEIRSMPYTDLERWWEVDFDVLASTAVAEATGPVHPTVTEALRSEDWLEQWADALYAASGELASSVERMTFLSDGRLDRTKKRYGQVEQRRGQVNHLVRDMTAAQGWEMLPDHMKDARTASLSMLARHNKEEFRDLVEAENARRGLAPHRPFWGEMPYKDRFDAIEDAVVKGVLEAPVTPELEGLLRLADHQFTVVVARDVTVQEERCSELRHPLLLGRWLGALEHLRDRHCELAGLTPSFTVSLPRLDMRDLASKGQEEARTILNRRRFIRAIAQRHRECMMHARETVRIVSVRREEIERPWYEAARAAREELARRHPEQLQALLRAFEPFCEPGTTAFRRDAIKNGGAVNKDLIPTLKKALADGTWRRLLDGTAA
jgi:hypothetical protein